MNLYKIFTYSHKFYLIEAESMNQAVLIAQRLFSSKKKREDFEYISQFGKKVANGVYELT